MPEPAHKRQRTPSVYATPLMIPTTALGLSIRLSMFELRETGDRGHLPRSPGTGEGGDWWSWPMGVKAKGTPRGCHREWNKTPASLWYPQSVFNKNSTLNSTHIGLPRAILFHQKVDLSEGCFGCHKGHFLVRNTFSWKPKKLTLSTVRIGDYPQRAIEVSGENSYKILLLKVWNKTLLAPVPFRAFFGLMGLSNLSLCLAERLEPGLLCLYRPYRHVLQRRDHRAQAQLSYHAMTPGLRFITPFSFPNAKWTNCTYMSAYAHPVASVYANVYADVHNTCSTYTPAHTWCSQHLLQCMHTLRKKCTCTRARAPVQRCRSFCAIEAIANVSWVLR